MFTDEDKTFIRAILTNPAELTTWLVYADWLDEHGNHDHAEFLRLMARRGQLRNTDVEWYAVEERIGELRESLSRHWAEVFDRPKIENCEPSFRFRCPKQWENLRVTRDPAARHCDACNKNVHYCHTLPEAQGHARAGNCVVVRLGVLRHPDDLKPNDCEELDEFMGMLDWEYDPPPPAPRPWWKFW